MSTSQLVANYSKLVSCHFTLLFLLILIGCRGGTIRDSIDASVSNPGHTYRATAIKRHYLLDNGLEDASPTTYVLLDKDMGSPSTNGRELDPRRVVMRPSQCGPLRLEWVNDELLKIVCDHCGLAMRSIGNHADKIGTVHVIYEGFPSKSFWE
jgi:hypothetical protein